MFLSERLLRLCACQLCVFYFLWAHSVEYYALPFPLNADATVAFFVILAPFTSVQAYSLIGKGWVTSGTRIVDLKSQPVVLTDWNCVA